MQPEAPQMLTLKMLAGTRDGLKDPHAILLSGSTAKAMFGESSPLNKLMRIDNKLDVKVTGVFEDLPRNSQFGDLDFIAPWDLYVTSESWIQWTADHWENSSFQVFAQIADHTDFKTVDKNIVDSKFIRDIPEDKHYKTKIFLAPMKDWHLRMQWENGIQTGGLIEYVRLFAHHRHLCAAACLHQFYEPEHREVRKKSAGSGCTKSDRLTT